MINKWYKVKLKDICSIELGRTPYRGNKAFWDKEKKTNNVWLSIADMLAVDHKIVSDSKEYISNLGAEKSKFVAKGTLLLSFKLTIGRLAFTGRDLFTNEAIAALVIKNSCEICKEYLYYYFSFFDWDAVTKTEQKIKGKTLNKQKLGELIILFPDSISEQQRIVAILDQAFAAIAKARENTECNLRNARELFESYLESIFSNPGEGWEEKKLGEVFIIERGGSPRPIDSYLTNSPDGINWIKIGDTKGITKYIYRTAQKIKPEGARRSRIVNAGDFILSNSMSFGRPYIMKTTGCIHDGWLVLRAKEPNIDQDFLYYVLSSGLVYKQFDNLAAGSTVRNLNIDLVKKVQIPIPPFSKQHIIANKIEVFSTETSKLEAVYLQKLAALDELKKSLLHKAFKGEL